MTPDQGFSLGVAIKNSVIAIAELLTRHDAAPGYIAAVLALLTAVICWKYHQRTRLQISAVTAFDSLVRETETITEFAEQYEEFRRKLGEEYKQTGAREALWEAWDEYSETIVLDDIDIDGPVRLRNSIRPASFLNIEDLGFGANIFRIVPTILVSVGLFLTFLGLVAALHQFAEAQKDNIPMTVAMQNFMDIASAKFIMSLTGLVCSILFTVLLRLRQTALDHALQRLCAGIERRLVFVSLEDIGFRQLKAAQEHGYGREARKAARLNARGDQCSNFVENGANL